jgi:hypothetical protein
MHKNEIFLNLADVEKIIINAGLSFNNLVELNKNGTDNRVFKIDDAYIIRLPRTKQASKVMEYEQKALKHLEIKSHIKNLKKAFFCFNSI